MTTTIQIQPHAAEPNEGVTLTTMGDGATNTVFIPNGSDYETVISGTQRIIINETVAPSDDKTQEMRVGTVTARAFNPSNNVTVDGIKTLVEHVADYINLEVPKCRRRSIALTHLETASMYAVKANFYSED